MLIWDYLEKRKQKRIKQPLIKYKPKYLPSPKFKRFLFVKSLNNISEKRLEGKTFKNSVDSRGSREHKKKSQTRRTASDNMTVY